MAHESNQPDAELIELMEAIAQLPTEGMTAKEMSTRLGVAPHRVYAALLAMGYTTAAGDYLPATGTPDEPQPLFERIALTDTSDMTIPEIAQRFDVSENRVRTALSLLARFAHSGGYKIPPRKKKNTVSEENADT